MNLRVKRPLALLLTVVMLLGLLPTAAFAAEPRSSAKLTTLTLTPASGESINLMTNKTPIQWSVLETWTLDLGANLVTGQKSTLTVTLGEGMQFVGLDVEALKDRLGVEDAVWTPGTPDWAENYENYEVKSGTLTITFDPSAAELEDFHLSLKPDTDLFPPELSGEDNGLAIEDAISVKLDNGDPYSADVTATHSSVSNPFFGDQPQAKFNVSSGVKSEASPLGGNIYAGWITQNGVLTKRLISELSAEVSVPAGLTLASNNDALEVANTGEPDTDTEGNVIWTVTANNIYAAYVSTALSCTILQEKAEANQEYVIKIKHIAVTTEGQESAFERSIDTTAWTIYVKDPNVVYIGTEELPASNVYNFTKNGNETKDFSDYNTVFAAVRLSNDGPTAIEKKLIYEAEFGENVQSVTAVGIPCDWDEKKNTGLPTSITITWNDEMKTTITDQESIREYASQFRYPGYGFMLLAKDLAGLENYGADKSIQAVKVELPGLPKDYVSAGAAPIQEGAVPHNTFSAAWGRVKAGAEDGTTDINRYRLYEKDAEETDENMHWTTVTTTVKDTGEIANGDSGSLTSAIKIDGKDGTTAAGGDMVEVTQTIMPQRYHNGKDRPAETIIVDPVVYILQPKGLTLYANQAEFTLNTGETITHSYKNVTSDAEGVPEGWEIYEYTFTGSDGEPIVLGWYDGDWCNEKGDVRMTAKFAYGVPADATAATYDIRDYVFYKSSLGMPFVRNQIGDPYKLNEGKTIGVVGTSTFTVQPTPQFIITTKMQRDGDGETWYTYDPNDSKATTALLGDDDKVNVQITVTNRTGNNVNGVTVYVPVPKTDSEEVLGEYFAENCGFDMLIASLPELPDGWEAYYGDVTKVHTIETGVPSGEFEFVGENAGWSSNYDNNTNLIQLRLNGTLAEGDTATLTLQLKPTGGTEQAGKTNLFKTWYTFNAAGVVMNDASKTTIFGAELQNGVVSGVVFEDTNRNGVQDANERGIPGVKVAAVDSAGRPYPEATTDKDGKYQFTSVPTDVTLTVTVHNPKDPDPNAQGGSYRFSPVGTETEGVVSNVTAETDNKSARKPDVSLSDGTATVNAGLITPYEVSFVVTGGSATPGSVKIYGGQKLDDVLPDDGVTVRPGEGATFQEKWTKHPVNAGESSEVEHDSLLNESVSADTTYTAQLEAKSYTIEAKYGETTYTETVSHSGYISADKFPTDEAAQAAAQEGYEFKGWKLSSSDQVLSRADILKEAVTAPATYFAQYERKSGISVTLDANGGQFGESETELTLTLTYGDIVTSAKGYVKPTRDGHTFLGWAESENAGSKDVISNLTCPAGNATYYAVWKENTYTITFQGYYQGQGSTSIPVKAGQPIGAENIPTAEKTGAEFKGWSDGEKTYSTEELAKVVPTANTTYTAKFTDIYSVTFYANGHGTIDGNTSTSYSVARGETLSDIPEVTASDGWYFVWWTDNSTIYTSKALESLPITGPMNFYAKYGQISGNTNITLKTPVDNSTNSTTLTASLDDEKAEATYKWQKLTGSDWVDVIGGTSASLSLPNLTMDDDDTQYQCVVTSGGSSATIGPVTLSVQKGEQEAPNVSYTNPSTIGGTGSIGVTDPKLTTAMKYKVGSNGNWTTVTETDASSGITGISAGTTYYIRYAETKYLNESPVRCITIAEPNTYTITVDDMKHGTITTAPSDAAAENATVTLTITPDEGYELKDDSLEVTYTSDGGEQTVEITDNKFTMPAHNVTVSAEFEAIKYSISYKLDGGINAKDNPTYYTVEDTITLSKPTREDYIFRGWTWDGQTTPQQNVTIEKGTTGKLTFTANWEKNTPTPPTQYTVTVEDSYAGSNSGAGSYAAGDSVTIYAGEYEGYTFAGWTMSPESVTLADADKATTTFTMPATNVTVTATWTKDEEPEPTPAGAITVTPADIIIYMGGKDGYEGTVNDKGDIVGSKSLPEPGFVFDLPDDLESALAAAGKDITDVKFQNEDGTKTWIVQLYQGLDESAANKLYTIVPTYEDHDSVRVVFTDGDKHIVSDNFEVGREINKDFGMSLYTGPAGKIKAVYGGQEYPVELGEGTLTVLGTTEKVSITTVTDQAPTNGQPGATATAGTTYTINDSEVEVTDSDVSLLFDNIINNIGNDRTGKLETRASEWLTSQGTVPTAQHQFVYELKYLDLVDANNGNAWVTASQNLTIYWPLPTGADADSLKVLHFKGLHRDMTTGEIESEIANCAVESLEFQVEDGYITFKVGSGGFSPFALVWEQAIPENTFIINATAGSGGSISPSGSVQVTAGDSQTFYITSDRGYHIADILVNGTSVGAVSSYTFQNVQENQTITAIFARDENWGGDTGNDGNDDDDDSYTLYYHSNFGRDKTFYQTDDQRIMVVRDYEDMSRLPDREDYVFLGWNTRADGSGEDYAPGDKFRVKGSADHLYAMWEQTMPDLLDTGVSRWLNTEDHGAYLSGYGGGLFGADNSMTRAEVAQMFYALLKDKNVTITKTFYDVPADAWYATAVNTLASLGMVSGGTDGNYRPNDPITRAEFCVIALAFAYEPENARCNFTDVTLSDWFYPYVAQAASYGWIGGYTDGSFGPNDSITRAQVTTIVNNMLGRSADVDYVNRHTEELNRFTDVPSTHWAYYQIVEATNAHDYDHVKGQENWTRLHR